MLPFYLASPDGSLKGFDPNYATGKKRNWDVVDPWQGPYDGMYKDIPGKYKDDTNPNFYYQNYLKQ
jgi:hypothetical protein